VRILVVGSGGREHALAWRLASSARVEKVFAGPGNAGTGSVATNLPGVDPALFDTILSACRQNRIDCVFVGPEAPLAAGVIDFLSKNGVPAIGPGAGPARLESSKSFSKAFLVRNNLPTAQAREFTDRVRFEDYVRERQGRRLVIKKSGLAAGKGVLESSGVEESIAFGRAILSDDSLLVEEFLEGWEVSIFGLSDGKDFVVLPPCTDFKKAHDGDAGPNTGGMGSICPVPWVDAPLMDRIRSEVVAPVYAALAREGLAYPGVLYFGLMITAQGPKVLEFNVRFGDPETQVLLPVLALDLGELMESMASGTLATCSGLSGAATPAGAALGVVIAGRGYPENAEKGAVVSPIPELPPTDELVFHASTFTGNDGKVRTGGGRCFTAVGLGRDLAAASEHAYRAAPKVCFDGAWYRGDIGKKFMEKSV
jgi:phosphoribosylamine--glycine ligase